MQIAQVCNVTAPRGFVETDGLTRVAVGKSKYEPENHMLVWRVRRFPGQAEFSLSAEVGGKNMCIRYWV